MKGIVYRKGPAPADVGGGRRLLDPERGLPLTGSLMMVAVMASAGLPRVAGFISEFLVFFGSIRRLPLATLALRWWAQASRALFFLLLVNRAFFGRLAITPSRGDGPQQAPPGCAAHQRGARGKQIPALALAAAIVVIGLVPDRLGA